LRLLRAPIVHFLAIGAALFAIERVLEEPEPEPVVIPAAERERLHQELARSLGREPSERELRHGLDAWIDEELLVREARALGWHRSDPVVQMRLVRNLRFVSDDAEADADTLLEQAYALEMDRNDLVVRRRLAERMRMAITARLAREAPPEAELRAILARDADRLRRPALVHLSHVYLSRDRRGVALEAEAEAKLAQLRAEAVDPDAAERHGDPFLVPARLPLSSEQALAGRLGPDFARAAMSAPEGTWSGPIPSAYGLHLLWVRRHVAARDPELEEVRSELLATWRREQERRLLREALAQLRADAGLGLQAPGEN
jgi:hypothetical protein